MNKPQIENQRTPLIIEMYRQTFSGADLVSIVRQLPTDFIERGWRFAENVGAAMNVSEQFFVFTEVITCH